MVINARTLAVSIISKSPSIKKMHEPKSSKMHTHVGSGSRPTKSKHKIPTSAPENAQGLGRKPAGSLK